MKKLTTLFAVLGVVLALGPAAQAAPMVGPTDGYTGPYRIIFCTVTKYTAVETDITVYNARIEAAAAGRDQLPLMPDHEVKGLQIPLLDRAERGQEL